MTDYTYDLEFLKIGLDQLEPYLLTDELFWMVTERPSGQQASFPQLTLGNLLISLARLQGFAKARQLSPRDSTELARLERQLESVRSKWRVAWENKAHHEFTSRLHQWVNYLDELVKDRADHAPFYHTEVRLRALLELLRTELSAATHPDLTPLDAQLKAILHPGDFIWEEGAAAAFPQEKYWFLYGFVQA